MDIPKLKQNQCSVLIVEHSTGIVYKKDLTVYRNSKITNDVFEIFESYTQAEEFVKKFILKWPKFECLIYDHLGTYLKTFDTNGFSNLITS